jgi:G:T/U-mismatch repair DNA glycosylase
MPIIFNKFREHKVSPQTEILILGTFNPDSSEGPDFFYGRARNFLWHLLPQCWGLYSLKEASLSSKQEFMATYKIDFADLIDSLEVPEGEEANVDDDFIDGHVKQWKDIIDLIETLPNLKEVYFTRKTFNGIPNMKSQVNLVANHCKQRGIRICKLETPARHFSDEKQQQWIDSIVLQTTCLRV